MSVETKTYLYTMLFSVALIAIGITLLRKKNSYDKEKALNYRLSGIFSLAIGIMFGIYRSLVFFFPFVADLAGLFIIIALIVINIIVFKYWKNRDKNENLKKTQETDKIEESQENLKNE